MEDKAKLANFYIQNLTLKNMNFWDPNTRLGDMQLMALASWMTHEETRDEEVKRVMKKDEKEPLYIRVEWLIPRDVISNHGLIFDDVALAPKFLAT